MTDLYRPLPYVPSLTADAIGEMTVAEYRDAKNAQDRELHARLAAEPYADDAEREAVEAAIAEELQDSLTDVLTDSLADGTRLWVRMRVGAMCEVRARRLFAARPLPESLLEQLRIAAPEGEPVAAGYFAMVGMEELTRELTGNHIGMPSRELAGLLRNDPMDVIYFESGDPIGIVGPGDDDIIIDDTGGAGVL